MRADTFVVSRRSGPFSGRMADGRTGTSAADCCPLRAPAAFCRRTVTSQGLPLSPHPLLRLVVRPSTVPLVLVWLLALSSVADAVTRYAAPTPVGAGDCSSPANACSLGVAVGEGSQNDSAELASGTYDRASALWVTDVTDIHGTPGEPRPVVRDTSGGDAAIIVGTNGDHTLILRHVEIDLRPPSDSSPEERRSPRPWR